MHYTQEFFAVQLEFAQKMAALTQKPYAEAVLQNTAFYRIFGLDWSFDASNPLWQEYCAGLRQGAGDVDWTYGFYLAHLDDIPEYDPSMQHWGCFAYEYLAEKQLVHLHFAGSLDRSGYGPLTSLRKEARLTELRSMFTHIKERHLAVRLVQGSSWLYSRKEYTRLFPAEYGQAAFAAKRPHLRARGLWGQFLRHDWSINEQVAALFRERLARLQDPAEYERCFPYPLMLTQAPIELFYSFYEINA